MSLANWKDLPDTAAEFIQRFGDVPTILQGQEQQAVEALRAKVNENKDWKPLYLQVKQSIDDIEDDDDSSTAINDSDDNSYDCESIARFNKLLRKAPCDSLFQRLHECLSESVLNSTDANLEQYIMLAPYVIDSSSYDIQSQFADDLDAVIDCVDSCEQDGLEADMVARAAIQSREIRNTRIKTLEKENRTLKRRLDDDDAPIFKKRPKKIIDDDD